MRILLFFLLGFVAFVTLMFTLAVGLISSVLKFLFSGFAEDKNQSDDYMDIKQEGSSDKVGVREEIGTVIDAEYEEIK